MKKILYLTAVAALGLTACSDDALSFGDDELAVRFTAAVNGNLSRASSGTPLASGTTVRISNGGDYFGYRADCSGNLLPTDGDFIRWSNMVQSTMEISAYSPATEGTSLTSFTVPTDQSTADGLANADYATFQGSVDRIVDTNDVTFTLERHQSQVNVLISDVDEDYKDCIFDVTIYSDGTPIKPYNGENISLGSTATAIIAPNVADANAKFIAVQVKTADGAAVGEPLIALGTPDLTAGNSYTFRLTVHNEALTIASVTLTDWANLTLTGGEADLAHEGDLYIYLQDYDTAADVRARINEYCVGTAIHKNVYISGRLGNWSLWDIVGFDYRTWTGPAVENLNLDEITDLEALPDSCFLWMSSLQTISATQLQTISYASIGSCTSLTSVNFPNATYVGEMAFVDCRKLTSLYLPKVTSIGNGAFAYCTSLTSLYIPSATDIEFNNLLSRVTTTNIDLTLNGSQREYVTDDVTWNSYTFKSIDFVDLLIDLDEYDNSADVGDVITNYHNSATTEMNITFIGSLGDKTLTDIFADGEQWTLGVCLNFDEVKDLYKFDVRWWPTTVKSIRAKRVTYIERIISETIKSIDCPSVTEVDHYAFNSCVSLEEINLPSAVTIGTSAFEWCSALRKLNLQSVESCSNTIFKNIDTSVIDLTLGVAQKSNVTDLTWHVPGQWEFYTFKSITFVSD